MRSNRIAEIVKKRLLPESASPSFESEPRENITPS